MDYERRDSGGKKVFFCLIAAITLIVISVFAILSIEGKEGNTPSDNSQKGGDASLTISDSKTYNEKNSDGTLTPVEIAEKVKPSVVAVVVYSGNTKVSEGSGVVMGTDSTGTYTYVITCAHIVNGKGIDAKIELEDKKQYDAVIVGYDSRTDIGVLRVKATGFTAAEFGDSTKLKVGEPVYAIGNPGGTAFYGSFTGGFVSAIDRPTSNSSSAYTMECIQHDAAINPGNSGGPIVNSYGQVVGINSSKIAAEEFEGMGFAVPISVAKEVVDDIIATGYVADRAKLGISYLEASTNQSYSIVLKKNDLPAGSIVIATIDSASSLAKTEVSVGDMIIAVNGEKLDESDIILKTIEKSKVGDTLKLTIAKVNDDYSVKTFDVEVKLIEDRGSSAETTTDSTTEGFKNPFAQ